MEKARIVSVIGLLKKLSQSLINMITYGQRAKLSVILDASSLADPKEDNSINNPLYGEV